MNSIHVYSGDVTVIVILRSPGVGPWTTCWWLSSSVCSVVCTLCLIFCTLCQLSIMSNIQQAGKRALIPSYHCCIYWYTTVYSLLTYRQTNIHAFLVMARLRLVNVKQQWNCGTSGIAVVSSSQYLRWYLRWYRYRRSNFRYRTTPLFNIQSVMKNNSYTFVPLARATIFQLLLRNKRMLCASNLYRYNAVRCYRRNNRWCLYKQQYLWLPFVTIFPFVSYCSLVTSDVRHITVRCIMMNISVETSCQD